MSFLSRILGHRVLPVSCARPQNSPARLRSLTRSISTGRVPKGYILGGAFVERVTTASASLPVLSYNTRHYRVSSFLSSLLGTRRSYCALRPMSVPPAGSATAQPNVPEDEHRLPLTVKPLHYDITILTDLEKLRFEGSVAIE